MSGLSQQSITKDEDKNSTSGAKTSIKKKRKSTEDNQESDGRSARLRNTKRKKSESSPDIESTEEKQSSQLCQTDRTSPHTEVISALIETEPIIMGSSLPSNNANSSGSNSSYDISSEDEDCSHLKIAVRKSRGTTNLTEETPNSSAEIINKPRTKERYVPKKHSSDNFQDISSDNESSRRLEMGLETIVINSSSDEEEDSEIHEILSNTSHENAFNSTSNNSLIDENNDISATKVTNCSAHSFNDMKRIDQERLEEELKCSICSEVFIKAVTLNCSHSFCKYCILKWRKNHTTCPICRQRIQNQNPTLVLDKCVEKVVECFEEDALKRRSELVDHREKTCEQEPPPSRPNLNDGQYFGMELLNLSYSDYSEEINSIADDFFDYNEFEWENEAYSPPPLELSQGSDSFDINDGGDEASVSYTESELEDLQDDEETEDDVLQDVEDMEDVVDMEEVEDMEDVDNMEEEEFSDDEQSTDDESDVGNRCFNCGDVGHMARYCPTAVNYTGVPGAYFGGYGVCFKCNQEGHWANGCPN